MVMPTDRFEETKGVVGGIAYPAHTYGKVIYTAYSAQTSNARLRATVVAIGREAGDDEEGQEVEGDPEPLDATPGGTIAPAGAGPFAPRRAPLR